MSRLAGKAEEALLGAALLNPGALPALRWLPPGAFSHPAHATLWQVLHRLAPGDISPMAVTAELATIDEPGLQETLSSPRLFSMVSACKRPGHAPLYAGMTLESAIHRAVEDAGHGLRAAVEQAALDDVTAVLGDVDQAGQRLGVLGQSWAAAPETVRNLLDIAPEEETRIGARAERARVDLRAEAETVASLLYQPAQMAEVGWLRPEDFSDGQLATAYRALATLADRGAPIDPLTLAWEAQRQPGPQLSEQVLDELDRGGIPGTAAFTGEQVLRTSVLDQVDAAGHALRNLARLPALAPTGLLDHAEAALQPVAADRDRVRAVEREPELAEQEPAPAGTAPAPHHPNHEMEIDL